MRIPLRRHSKGLGAFETLQTLYAEGGIPRFYRTRCCFKVAPKCVAWPLQHPRNRVGGAWMSCLLPAVGGSAGDAVHVW